MASLVLIMTSFADEETAAAAVHCLVEERLAACGTLLPKARSIYSWQGKIEDSIEVVVWIKTSQVSLEHCQQRLQELHPYEVPEMIVLEPSSVSPGYLQWMQGVLGEVSSQFFREKLR